MLGLLALPALAGGYVLVRPRRAHARPRRRAPLASARADRADDGRATGDGLRRHRSAVPRSHATRAERQARGLGARQRHGARGPLHQGGAADHHDRGDRALRAAAPGVLLSFRLLRGPAPHVVETYELRATPVGTEFVYREELGADLWAIGAWWAGQVAGPWERAVAASLDSIQAEAERRAGH